MDGCQTGGGSRAGTAREQRQEQLKSSAARRHPALARDVSTSSHCRTMGPGCKIHFVDGDVVQNAFSRALNFLFLGHRRSCTYTPCPSLAKPKVLSRTRATPPAGRLL